MQYLILISCQTLSNIIQNSASNYRDTKFNNEIAFRFGVEAELIMPFNKNKWSIAIEPNFQHFIAEKTIDKIAFPDESAKVVVNTIEGKEESHSPSN